MYVWAGGGGGGRGCSVPWSLRPLLTQLRLQRNVLSEVEGEERCRCSVIDRPLRRKDRCVCRLHATQRVSELRVCNFKF